jgi:glycosyltransferase involved in cell wall biosynthesis
VVVCGASTRDEMVKIYRDIDPQKISVINNGINFEKINKIENSSSWENDSLIVFFGRLIWRKGILHLVKALSFLTRDFPELKLKIFGTGPLEQKIKTLSTELNLQDNVDLLGHVPYAELIENIKKSSLVALPSLYEVGPYISALEAMACKKPLVVFDSPFTREFILNMRNGVMAKSGDAKDLSEKISLLLRNEDLRREIGKNAYDFVNTKHDWNVLVDQYLKIYESLT